MREEPASPAAGRSMKILIVAEHASARFGGEAALPLHYFRVLRRRGFEVRLITHARTRSELSELFPDTPDIFYIEDSRFHKLMYRMSGILPSRVAYSTVGFASRLSVQLEQRRLIKRLVGERCVDIVHQPMPVSPREPSMMSNLGVPVVIGPMNGGMDYPPAFRRSRGMTEKVVMTLGRASANVLNRVMPGKRNAAKLLVANKRTRAALPAGVNGDVVGLVENGVDLNVWKPDGRAFTDGAATAFVFMGRLVDWKAVDLLLHAFARARSSAPMRLWILGDGPERHRLGSLAAQLGLTAADGQPQGIGCVEFAGWLSQADCAVRLKQADCLVLPSLLECGGAVVLEAMSLAKPVIATAWGGPLDYLDESCGVLIAPDSREALISGMSDAMASLAADPTLRDAMGRNGLVKAHREYDWERKVDRMLEIYADALAGNGESRGGTQENRAAALSS